MSDDEEADPSLLALLRDRLYTVVPPSSSTSPETGVLRSAEYIYNNSIDVAIDFASTRRAASTIYNRMKSKQYSTQSWSAHDLHPKAKDEGTVNFIFTMDLLNFSFWSETAEEQRFAVEYRGKRWTGYWSLVACLQRAVDEGTHLTPMSACSLRWCLSVSVIQGSLTLTPDEQGYRSPILTSGKTRKNVVRSSSAGSSAPAHQTRCPCSLRD